MNKSAKRNSNVKQINLKDTLPKRTQPAQGGGSFLGMPSPGSLPDFGQNGPKTLNDRLLFLKENANFQYDQHQVRDGVALHVFVRHEAFDASGRQLPDDGSYHPGAKLKKAEDNFDSADIDPGIGLSSDSEENIDYNDDAEDTGVTVSSHRFTIDFVSRYADPNDDLILHWGMSRQKVGAWGSPDSGQMPPNSQKWPDGLACQTIFQKEDENPSIRTITVVISWVEDVDQPVNSISYVLTEKQKNAWHNVGGSDQCIVMCPSADQGGDGGGGWQGDGFEGAPKGKIGDCVNQILDCEVHKNSWTLMHRYHKCTDLLKSGLADTLNRDHVVFFYIWLRYSFSKQLTWQKSYNTKPKELQHSQVMLTNELCEQYKYAASKQKGDIFLSAMDIHRAMLGFIGKGSGNGQQVRDEILHIMHRNNIKESAGHFYEEWHQKLHNNTTPDDVPICEALLAYLKSGGDMGKYWDHLKKNGIDKARLASYERKITHEPWLCKQAIGDFENYLRILKQMHSSDDVNMLIEECKRHVGGDTHHLMGEIQRNFGDQDALRQMDRVLALRGNLCHNHIDKNNTQKLKDVLFLDLALEGYVRALTERIMHHDIGFEAYIREISIIMNNLCLTYSWSELKYCRDDWEILARMNAKNMNEDNARKVKSVVDRLKQALGEVNDVFADVMQKKGEMMGRHFKAQDYAVTLFSEEALRGTLFFSLSMILKKIDPHVRNCAHLGDWLIISQGRTHGSRGYVERVPVLRDVMHKTYSQRTILLVEKITGEEEVPSNVQAIIVLNASDYPDVLAHVSVRARNLKVLLTVNFNENTCNDLLKKVSNHLQLSVEGQNVKYVEQNPNMPLARRASSHMILQGAIDEAANLEPPPMFTKSLLYMQDWSTDHSGGKSNNLKTLRDKLDHGIKLPESASIPFQFQNYSIALEPEKLKKLNNLIEQISIGKSVKKMNKNLYRCKEIILNMKFHQNDPHHQNLKAELIKFGIPPAQFDQAWYSIKRVWASKFNERAFLATKKLGVTLHQIFMAVLVQRVIPAEYAYVIHTTNPTNGNDNEVYVEACLGLGEALVSDMPGQAISFSYDKQSKQTKINSYPNKSLGLTTTGFIFRSDSNSEDLPGFAGAGLFDSYTMTEETRFRISYNQERLVVNEQFRNTFMNKVGVIGHHIEKVYDDEPQDVEGCFYNNEYYVVQTRPQV